MGDCMLRFCYQDHHVDIVVADIDKVMWIDLINEYEEEFRKKNYVMPEFPSFKFHVNEEPVQIETDSDLMRMLELNKGINPIYIIVGKLNKMSECVQTARQLQCSLKEGNTSNKDVYVGGNIEIICRGTETLNFDPRETWEDVQIDIAVNGKKTKTRRPPTLNPRRKKKDTSKTANSEPVVVLSQTTSFSNTPLPEQNVIPSVTNNVPKFHKKIPRTTAVRKGLATQTVTHDEALDGDGYGSVHNANAFNNPLEIVVHNNAIVGVSIDGTVRNDKKGNGDVEYEVSNNDLDKDEGDETEIPTMIEDNYDPYCDEFWQEDVDNDDSYLKRVYNNGEFYKDEGWGKIVLKPWMLFSDKQHFQQVLRDYCIQCAFALLVEKSSPTRFTACCLDLNCQWRIHSSRLPDGRTWAIKSIKNAEHTCQGLDDKNPLVSVEWAADKLMDDIKANNDITGPTLNDILMNRYGVVMAKTSLYKMRALALKMINGGHDESYSFLPKYAEMGIEPALNAVWPKAGRRYCCKHLAKNWKGEFSGPLMHSLFWRAASATSPFTFRKAMERIEKENPLARIWLANLGDQSRWTRHKFDPKICSEENKSNFVESFNATLGIDRCRPVLTLLEDNEPCPNIVARIKKITVDSRSCKAYESGPGEYEVKDGRSMLPVSLNKRTCICGAWQISGIPCKHAVRAIISAQDDTYKYTSTWYYGAVYKQAYGNKINSIPDEENWPDIDMPSLQPPPLKRGVGRPPSNRRREEGEKQKGKRSTTSRCSKCGEWGHNVRTCKGGLTAKQKQVQQQSTSKQTAAKTKSAT
ncbi:Methionyl-tRNA formyltransferase [Bienertia sinuspersici]